ncbi:MAG: ABC transporter substrate-binding protein [Colwellia sp.]|nr:ABC transporter substrate-binding protein [Colwellia sp.]
MRIFIFIFTFTFCQMVSASSEQADIVLVSSSALSGPAAQLGLKLNQGANIYFDHINKLGGIENQKIKFISLDDGYEPYKALQNTQKLLNRGDVFAFFNYVGTPTTHVVLPIIKQSELPFLTPFTGAEFLRKPVTDTVYNLRASYYQEAKAQIDYLVNVVKTKKIGLLIQADEFGATVEQGYLIAMTQYGIEPIVTTRFRRNTQDISLALSILKSKEVEAVSFVGTYEPFAELINSAYQQSFTPFFTTVSFISSRELFLRIKQPSRVLVTEVLPQLKNCTLSICLQFKVDMERAGISEVDQVQFEGYLNAHLFVEVMKRCTTKLTHQCFFDNIKMLQADFGGLDVRFSSDTHQGLNQVYLNLYQ